MSVPVIAAIAVASLLTTGCAGDGAESGDLTDLSPYPNRFDELVALWEPQPHRENPAALVLSADESKLYVALAGSVDEPGDRVVVVDLEERRVIRAFRVGRAPTALALHPEGRVLAVANRFSPYLSVVDLVSGEVSRVATSYYVEGLAFGPDGHTLYLANRWHDTLERWDVRVVAGELVVDQRRTHPVAPNPRDVLASSSGVWVASVAGLSVAAFEPDTFERRYEIPIGAPANGMVVINGRLVVATLSASTHHPAHAGPDTDGDGVPGDGTPNVGFQDLQNELAVFDASTGRARDRYTSDTICCFDFRDVSPADPDGGDLLPPREHWIVGGALPERITRVERGGHDGIAVIYSGSNEAQWFAVAPDGALTAGPIAPTGFQPVMSQWAQSRDELYVVNRLGESVTVIDVASFEPSATIVVGDISGGAFPATDAEIGELFYFAGADYAVDGDQTCNHCHRERGNIAKAFSMPLLADPRGSRMTPAARGMFETRPWFVEGAMDENNFFPVINEFARAENFCCHGRPDSGDCLADPPPTCAERPAPLHHPSRDAFFQDTSRSLLGRTRSFGGAIDTRLDYLGMTRLLGLFLLHEPALLPNPNDPQRPNAQRGRKLFSSATTACASCHPPPGFAVSFEDGAQDVPLHVGPVVTPTRAADGANLDRAHDGFLSTFPLARQRDDGQILLNPTTLLGIWDRAPGFLHDGRAPTLLEALATPGHEALRGEQHGFNVSDGVPDTHGGTSHLTAGELADLVEYLESL